LSTDAIAALVEAAREGRLPEEASAPQRRRRMRAVDFTRPTKFTADQERRLKRSLEAFCRSHHSRSCWIAAAHGRRLGGQLRDDDDP
jgi:flagellar motor switch protein FliM